jgi:uncharacterized repeat protein (TIGR03803 family)
VKIVLHSLALLIVAWFLAAADASAVTFTNLYIFSADAFAAGSNPVATNRDGVNPNGFVLSGNTLYGTAAAGGLYGYGTVFRVNTDGTHFTNLFSFNNGAYDPTNATYPDSTGDQPSPGLLLVSNVLYGTTFYGGTHFAGTVFKVNTDGSDFAVLHAFDDTDGQGPASGLTLYSNALYGTAVGGGSNGFGTIFKISLSDLSFATVYDFTNQVNPYGGVVVSSNLMYGFGQYGGASSNGIVYRVGLGGDGYVDLFDFNGTNGSGSYSTPTLSGNTLFGVTYQGGTNGGGNVFRINTDGLRYTNLYSFPREGGANTTGANPYDFAGLVLSGNILYGTTSVSGSGSQGTVFQLNTDGTGFTVLHSFQYTDGGNPEPLVLSGGTLYGMTLYGFQGISLGDGGVFALILQPALNLALADNQAVLTWNDPSYSLYAALAVTNVFTKITGATSPYTNTVTAPQKFFQLRAN